MGVGRLILQQLLKFYQNYHDSYHDNLKIRFENFDLDGIAIMYCSDFT